MSRPVSVSVSTNQIFRERLELVLESRDGKQTRWSKIYDGAIFLNMDAQSPGLINAATEPPAPGPDTR